MDKKEIKKKLKANYEVFKELNYSINTFEEISEVYISLSKHTDNNYYEITLPLIGINGIEPRVKIGHKQIESIIRPIMKKAKIWGNIDLINVTTSSLYTLENEIYNELIFPKEKKDIKTENDIINLLQGLKKYIKEVAEPFFEKWSDLKVLNDFFDEIPQREVGKYFGQGATLRKAIVYKLCNNPNFEEYFEKLYNHITNKYKNNPNGDESLKKWNDAVIELEKVLINIEPKYNVC